VPHGVSAVHILKSEAAATNMDASAPSTVRPQDETAILAGLCETRIWGMSGTERAERLLKRLGYNEVWIAAELSVFEGHIFQLRTDVVIDEKLLRTLQRRTDWVLAAPTEAGYVAVAASTRHELADAASRFLQADAVFLRDIDEAGLTPFQPDDIAQFHDAALRKKGRPYVAMLTEENAAQVHRDTFNAAYKGVTDVVTKYLWPPLALPLTRICANLRITPNQVTAASLVLSIATFYCFAQGYYAAGLLAAWIMALLDTVDGKLARVTLTSSKWGNIFDHGIDLVAPPLWWFAWWWGLGETSSSWVEATVWVVLGGHVAGKLLEQAFISTFGFKVHIWQRFDSAFRLITARRNPNLIILTIGLLVAGPTIAYLALAVWIIVCFDVHAIRYIQAYVLRQKGYPIRSWLDA